MKKLLSVGLLTFAVCVAAPAWAIDANRCEATAEMAHAVAVNRDRGATIAQARNFAAATEAKDGMDPALRAVVELTIEEVYGDWRGIEPDAIQNTLYENCLNDSSA